MSLETRKISLAQLMLSLQKEDIVKKFEEFAAYLRKSEDLLIPEWQIQETRRRLSLLDDTTNSLIDFDQALDDIEKDL